MTLPAQVFVGTRPDPAQLKPVANRGHWKPTGGLWTSSLEQDTSAWIEWCKGEGYARTDAMFGWGEAWLLKPLPARVCRIANPDDLVDAGRRYPGPLQREMAELTTFRYALDWEALARDYDAVWIPSPMAHRFSANHEASMFFYVMDVESTLWFRWCFAGEPARLHVADAGGEA